MDIKNKQVEFPFNDQTLLVGLKWMRGTNRYNNGGGSNDMAELMTSKHLLRMKISSLKSSLKHSSRTKI